MTNLNDRINHLAALLKNAENAIVFTGAGCSTESGILDFRSPGGVWSKYRMITFQEFLTSEDDRREQWKLHYDLYKEFANCKPNPAHYAITDLYSKNIVKAVITQNIDSLHQQSGMATEDVIELHGNESKVICLNCNKLYTREEIQKELESGTEIPLCELCNGLLKTTTVWFGESLPQRAIDRAFLMAENCDLFIVVGSSLAVYPAALVPEAAHQAGAKLVIINRDNTPLDSCATLRFSEPAGEVLSSVVSMV